MRYQPFYCEENIWCLVRDRQLDGEVIFISNEAREVAIWRQRAAPNPMMPVVWDYHVVFHHAGELWDLDSTLGAPVSLETWIDESFSETIPKHQPRFRVFDARWYESNFCSDRRHMREDAGVYREPAPPWPCIGIGHNLPDFLDFSTSLSLFELAPFLAQATR